MCDVLESLTNDSNQWARQILQDTVDVVSFIIDEQLRSMPSEQQDEFKSEHAAIVSTLMYLLILRLTVKQSRVNRLNCT